VQLGHLNVNPADWQQVQGQNVIVKNPEKPPCLKLVKLSIPEFPGTAHAIQVLSSASMSTTTTAILTVLPQITSGVVKVFP
jgi:hypothetical protein